MVTSWSTCTAQKSCLRLNPNVPKLLHLVTQNVLSSLTAVKGALSLTLAQSESVAVGGLWRCFAATASKWRAPSYTNSWRRPASARKKASTKSPSCRWAETSFATSYSNWSQVRKVLARISVQLANLPVILFYRTNISHCYPVENSKKCQSKKNKK